MHDCGGALLRIFKYNTHIHTDDEIHVHVLCTLEWVDFEFDTLLFIAYIGNVISKSKILYFKEHFKFKDYTKMYSKCVHIFF